MKSFRNEQIGINDAATILGVRTSELKQAIREETLLRGVQPPQPRHQGGRDGTGGWVFTAGVVMDAAAEMKKTGSQ